MLITAIESSIELSGVYAKGSGCLPELLMNINVFMGKSHSSGDCGRFSVVTLSIPAPEDLHHSCRLEDEYN